MPSVLGNRALVGCVARLTDIEVTVMEAPPSGLGSLNLTMAEVTVLRVTVEKTLAPRHSLFTLVYGMACRTDQAFLRLHQEGTLAGPRHNPAACILYLGFVHVPDSRGQPCHNGLSAKSAALVAVSLKGTRWRGWSHIFDGLEEGLELQLPTSWA